MPRPEGDASEPLARTGEVVPVSLSYSLSAPDDGPLSNPFFRVLGTLRRVGSIAGAARELSWSYRHLWGYLKAQELALGRPLVRWDKGRAARLTEFAEKLLWAESRILARLAPQIENLGTEISRELTIAFDDRLPIASCVASHDPALPELRRLCAESSLLFDLRYAGSIEALDSLRQGGCRFAGIHLPLGRPELAARGSAVHRAFGGRLRLGREKLIRVCQRQQGLMLAPGNPLGVRRMADLGRLRFVNRDATTGTRALLDELLRQDGIDPATIDGHDRIEPTHLAVAIAVASGSADAGFGLHAAASSQGLAFQPLVQEEYFLVCAADTIETEPAVRLRQTLASPAWAQALQALPGYRADGAGEVVSLRRTLPWYR